MAQGLVGGEDSTHLKANANKHCFERQEVETPATVEKKISLTDPDSGYMVRDGKPTGFFYLDHRTVDGKYAIITDTLVTPASVHDSVPYLARLDHQCQRFGLDPVGVGLDAGYFTAAICHGLEERGLYGVIGYRRPSKLKGYLPKRAYTYDAASNTYQCPEGQSLIYATTDRNSYRHYRSDPDICCGCPRLAACTRNARQIKTVTRHVWQDDKDRVDARRLTELGKKLYKRRKRSTNLAITHKSMMHLDWQLGIQQQDLLSE